MGSKMFFALVILASEKQIVGKVREDYYDMWCKGERLVMYDPKMVMMTPVPGPDGKTIQGFKFEIMMLYPHKTRQKEAAFDPASVELIGELTTDASGELMCLDDPSGLFKPYLSMIKQWEGELANVTVPTMEEIAAINNPPTQPKGTLPFLRNRK